MPRIEIEGFVFDEANEEKIGAHGLTIAQVDQILDESYVVVLNRKGRRAPLLLVGHDHGGTCIATPIEPSHYDGWWRPITAWRCKLVEQRLVEGS